jgi:uncharacterized protein (TIGR02996 family)
MTGDEEAFVSAVCESPDEDAPRLVYADWLDDHRRHERATFIRAQCRLAALKEWERGWWDLRREGWPRSGPEACGPTPPAVAALQQTGRPIHRRGFIEELRAAHVPAFLSAAPSLFASVPLRVIEVREPTHGHLVELADSPWLARLRGLAFGLGYADAPALARLGASPHAAGLRELRMRFGAVTGAGVAALVASPLFARLAVLDLSENDFAARIAAPFANALADRPGELALRELSLARGGFGAGEAARLVGCPRLAGLTELDFSGNHLGGAGVTAIAESPYLRGLEVLKLSRLEPGVPAMQALATSPVLAGVRWLELHTNQFGPAVARALGDTEFLCNLSRLDLGHNPLGDKGVRALAESPHLAGLAALDLGNCRVGDVGARALADSPHLAGLAHLALWNNPISEAARTRLRDRFGTRVLF